MNYDTILMEMLSRIQKLEEEVKHLREEQALAVPERENPSSLPKVTTADIRNFIENRKRVAGGSGSGEPFLVVRANDIHKAMHLRSRLPMVCNAMRQAMGPEDEILHETASGFSSTFEVRYNLSAGRRGE
jgi:2-phospho-L-lactate guanylyltransferase (CobY/MobA/RfbA family)